MSKHTPGPWATGPMEGSQGCRIWQTDTQGNVKSIVGFCLQSKPSRELDEETEANARLIAAAPELLAALVGAEKALVKALPLLPPDKEAVFCGEWLAEIRDAIAQATGDAP